MILHDNISSKFAASFGAGANVFRNNILPAMEIVLPSC